VIQTKSERLERPFGAAPSRWAIVAFLVLTVIGAACSEEIDPDQALQEGLAQQQAGKLDDAAELYDQVLQVRPGDKFANYNMGVIEQAGGRTELAEGFYRAALDTDPAFVPALFNLAIIRTGAGATQEAIDLYLRVIEAEPEHAAAHLNLGLLYAGTGEDELSQEQINVALELDPSLASRLGATTLPSASPAEESGAPNADASASPA